MGNKVCAPGVISSSTLELYRANVAGALKPLDPITRQELEALRFDLKKLSHGGRPIQCDGRGNVHYMAVVEALTALMAAHRDESAAALFGDAMKLVVLPRGFFFFVLRPRARRRDASSDDPGGTPRRRRDMASDDPCDGVAATRPRTIHATAPPRRVLGRCTPRRRRDASSEDPRGTPRRRRRDASSDDARHGVAATRPRTRRR